MADKKQYRVREGQTFGRAREYGPGTVLELTEEEAASFPDKLEALDRPVSFPKFEETPAPEETFTITPTPDEPAPKPGRKSRKSG